MPADNSLMSTLVMVVLMVAAFWLLLIRPAQKKQKQQQEMVSKLGEGSRVMLSSGVFGTVMHNGEKQAIVEIAPGVELTVLKQAIVRGVDPSEEEFEYDDVVEEETISTDAAGDATVTGFESDLPVQDAPEGTPGFEQPRGDEPKNNL